MAPADIFYRAAAWLKHRLTARNTLGYGVHSPYLYYIVRFLMYDDNRYYCFDSVEAERHRLLTDRSTVNVADYGTGKSGPRRVCDIAASSLMPRHEAQMLFRLVNHLHPATVVELGTSLGITTAYLSKAAPADASVYTLEGSASFAETAQKVWSRLGCRNIHSVQGGIADTLPALLQSIRQADFAIIDACHTYEATLQWFSLIADKCGEKSVVVVHDIHGSRGMGKAWHEIRHDSRVQVSFDLYSLGIVFFDRHLLHKHYVMNI